MRNEISDFTLFRLLWGLSKSNRIYLEPCLKHVNVTLNQYPYLVFIYDNNNCKQEDIASMFKVDKCGVSRILKKLEEKGLIIRNIDPKNRRSYKILLTKEGKDIVKLIYEQNKNWEIKTLKQLNISQENFSQWFKSIHDKSEEFREEIINFK